MNSTPEPLADLIREHRLIESVVATTQARLADAAAAPADQAATDAALEQLWELQLVLERDVEWHIAKEEVVLFPRLRQELSRLSDLVDALIDEHERIKAHRDQLRETLALLDDDHADVRAATARLRAGLAAAQAGVAPDHLAELQAAVRHLDWLFDGHFVGEEDGLFAPAEDVLSAEVFADLALAMAQFERDHPDSAGAPV